jgi:hypothetical protein
MILTSPPSSPPPFSFQRPRRTAADRDAARRRRALKQIRSFPRFPVWARKVRPVAWQIRLRLKVLRALAEVVAGIRPGPASLRPRRGSRNRGGRVAQNAQ